MSIGKRRLALSLCLALLASGSISNRSFADELPGTKQADSHHHDAAATEKKISSSLGALAPEDQKQAAAQRFCAVMEHSRLGSMGAPVKVTIEGKPVWVCCKACVAEAREGGKQSVEKAQKLRQASAVLAKLSPADRSAAEAQKYCAVAEGSLLGGMGAPIKLVLDGKPVFLCCKGCVNQAQANPAATIAKVDELKKAGADHEHHGSEK